MDGAKLSPYPHYSWLAHWIAIEPPRVFEVHEDRYVTHRLLLTTSGEAQIAWGADGAAVQFCATVGDIGFYPCDHAKHRLAITTTGAYRAYAILLPNRHLCDLGASDGIFPGKNLRVIPVFRDAMMQASLLRLSAGSGCRPVSEDIGDEIAARQIVIRLCIVAGCRAPDWQKDTSVFVPDVMRRIVERVDAEIGLQPSLEQLSRGFGLSPSHFARKFQQSTGLSLNRFINRRRIGLSLALLREDRAPLSHLSLALGFCSQSHFTRLFRALTGLTPYQYRRTCR